MGTLFTPHCTSLREHCTSGAKVYALNLIKAVEKQYWPDVYIAQFSVSGRSLHGCAGSKVPVPINQAASAWKSVIERIRQKNS